MNTRFFIAPLLALVLLGAGCAPLPATQTPPPATVPVTGEPRPLVAAQTDETWKAYANAALGFSFLTPTKGIYVPQWEVKIFPETAPEVADGYTAQGATIVDTASGKTSAGVEFFISHGSEGAAGSTYLNDAYSTHIGKSVVVIVFLKRAIMATIGDCVMQPGQQYWSEFAKPGSCIPFSEDEYQKTLDGIVGTFTKN